MPFLDLRIAQLHLRCTNPAAITSPFSFREWSAASGQKIASHRHLRIEATIHCSNFSVRPLVALLKQVGLDTSVSIWFLAYCGVCSCLGCRHASRKIIKSFFLSIPVFQRKCQNAEGRRRRCTVCETLYFSADEPHEPIQFVLHLGNLTG